MLPKEVCRPCEQKRARRRGNVESECEETNLYSGICTTVVVVSLSLTTKGDVVEKRTMQRLGRTPRGAELYLVGGGRT